MKDETRKFTALDKKTEINEILSSVYDSLLVKGYNPINQTFKLIFLSPEDVKGCGWAIWGEPVTSWGACSGNWGRWAGEGQALDEPGVPGG